MNKKSSSLLKRVRMPRTPAEWLEAVMNFIFFLCGMLAVGCVVLITVYMVISGVPAIHKIGFFKFLLGTKWASTAAEPLFGILPFILSSIYGTLGATLIGVPIGLLTAVFLSKAASHKVRTVVVTAIELLSGIPSVVFGLLGMQVLVPAVASRAVWRWVLPIPKPGSRSACPLPKAALPPASCWASAAPSARPWPL